MKGSLLKGKEISSFPLRLHEHKRYGVKNSFFQYLGAVGSLVITAVFVYINVTGDVDKN